MARIAGIDLPKDKRIEIGLTYIYGIGRTSAKKILEATGINPDTRVRDLSEADEAGRRTKYGAAACFLWEGTRIPPPGGPPDSSAPVPGPG